LRNRGRRFDVARTCISVAALLAVVAVSYAVQVPVSVIDNAFQPDTVIVNAGDSVIWTNNGTFIHTSTSGVNGVWDSLWDSGNMAHGVTFTRGFPTNGAFGDFCSLHWLGGMKGVVVVGASGVNETPGTRKNAARLAGSPNPFRVATTIRLAPTGVARGGVRVFDASGKLVRTIETANGPSVVWNGTDDRGRETGPGVYFCEYGSGALTVTRLR
jgi:plastocyanin